MNFYKNCVLCVIVMMLGCVPKENVREENSKENGFNLQQFVIVDKELQNVVDDLSFKLKDSYFSSHILILELRMYKSDVEFWFNFIDKEHIVYNISSDNKRIVGYIPIVGDDKDVIVLSNINDKFEFEYIFYKYVHPTENKKNIDFIYFNENQYQVDEKGRGCPPLRIRDYYMVYLFQDNQFVKQNTDTVSDFITNRKYW